MARNNVKLLNEKQLDELNSHYYFEPDGDDILVKIYHYGRITRHPMSENFSINAKIRKLVFTTEAMNIWREIYDDEKTRKSLIDIQNAVNSLYVMYQPITKDSVMKVLRDSAKIKRV